MDLWRHEIQGKFKISNSGLLALVFYFFIFFYPIFPQYAIFKINGFPGLTLQRFIFALVLTIFTFEILFFRQSFWVFIKCLYSIRILFSLLCIFFLIRFMSCIGFSEYSRSLFKVANELILWGGVVLVTAYLHRARRGTQKHLFSIFFYPPR